MIVDFHSHVFTQSYLEEMAKRTSYPRVENQDGKKFLVRTYERLTLDLAFFDIDTRIKDMDRQNVDISVISPANPWVDIFRPERAISLATRVNEEIASFVKESGKRFIGLGILPFKTPNAAIAELERAVLKLGLKGIIVGASTVGESLNSGELVPILQKASELRAVVFVHPNAPPGIEEMTDFRLATILGYPFETTLNITKMIYSGVFDKLPRLKVVVSHQGAALPYLIGRINQAYYDFEVCRRSVSKPPIEYVKKLFVDTLSYDSVALEYALRFFGEERIVYGTDYPFPLGGGRDGATVVLKVIDTLQLGAETRDKILSRNASLLLGIEK
jgi:aminocarboxymuconate-semialdehyde decarboxylase